MLHISPKAIGRLGRALSIVAQLSLVLYSTGVGFLLAAPNSQSVELVRYTLEGQRKDGVWTNGNICSGGGECYAEGENVPFRLTMNGLTSEQTYTLAQIQHDYQDDGGLIGYELFHTPTSEDGSASGLSFTNSVTAPCGNQAFPTCTTYDVTFTAESGTAIVNWLSLLGQNAAEWNGASLHARLVRGVEGEPVGNKEVPIQVNQIILRNLAVVKTDNPDPINLGESTQYTITITNSGEQAETVTVTDVLPTELVYVPGSGVPAPSSVSGDGRTLTWADIAVPKSPPNTVLTFSAQGVSGGTGTNTVAVQATGLDPVTDTEDTTVIVTNGSLKLTKVVESGGASPDAFSFTISPDLNGEGTVHTTNGEYVFSDLPAGAYTVSELPYTDYHVTSTTCEDVAVTAGQQASCEIRNARDTGTVMFEKIVEGGAAQPEDWTFTIDGVPGTFHHGDSVELATGAYTVSEYGPGGYTPTAVIGVCSNLNGASATLTVTINGGTCSFTNTRDTGSVMVNKKVDTDGNGTFESGNETANTLGFRWGLDAETPARLMGSTAMNVPTGTHTVDENTVVNYHIVGWYPITDYTDYSCSDPFSTSLPASIDVVDGGTTTIVLCNARDTAPLTVNKAVDTDGDGDIDIENATDWTWDLDGGNQNFPTGSTQTVTTGTHAVSEDNQGGYHNISWECWNTQNGNPLGAGEGTSLEVTVPLEGATCLFTNARDTGSITVNKSFDDDGDGNVDRYNPQGWTWDVVGGSQDNAGGSTVVLPTDTYTVTEDAINDYSSAWKCSNDTSGTGTSIRIELGFGDHVVCEFLNTRNTGAVSVHKQVDTDGDGTYEGGDTEANALGFRWGLDAELPTRLMGSTQATVPTGAHTVDENAVAGYHFTGWYPSNNKWYSCSYPYSTTRPAEIDVEDGVTAEVTFCNARDTGGIVVRKNVLNPDGEEVADNHSFTVELNGGQQQTIAEGTNAAYHNLPTGLYTVQELADADYAFGSYSQDMDGNPNNGAQILVVQNQTAQLLVTNKQKKATITLVKDVRAWDGSDVSDATSFMVSLDGQSSQFAEGSNAVFMVNPATYTAVETPHPDYLIDGYSPSDTVTVGSNESATITVTNLQNRHEATLAKDDSPDLVQAGSLLTYALTWENTGNAPITDVTIADAVPPTTTFDSADCGSTAATPDGGTCDISVVSDVITWSLGRRLPGESGYVTFAVQTPSPERNGTVLTNNALLAAEEVSPLLADEQTIVASDFSVLIDKSGPSVAEAGSTFSYSLAWSVSGNAPIDTLTITDPLPANTAFVSATDGGTENQGVVTWNLGAHVPGDSGVVSVTVAVASPLPDGAQLANTGTLCGTSEEASEDKQEEGAFIEHCDDDSETTTVNSAPILTVIKSDTPDPVQAGAQVTYAVQWTISGNSPATNVVLSDTLPANTTFVSASAGATHSGVNPGGVVTWNLGNHLPGESGSVTVTVATATPLANGTILTNTATIDSNENEPVSDTETTTVASAATLTLTKTDSADPVAPGGSLTYTLAWSVSGNSPVTNLILTDTLPAELTFVSTSAGGTHNGVNPGGVVTWNLGNHLPGDSGTATVTATVSAALTNGVVVTNGATVDANETAPASAGQTTTVTAAPVLTISKAVNLPFANPGDTATYTVTVTNNGNDTTVNLQLTDVLPAGFTFVDGGGATKTFALGNLEKGKSVTIAYTVTIDFTVTDGTYENLATAKADNHGPVTAKAPLEVRLPIVAAAVTAPTLTIEKTALQTTANPNDVITYVINIANNGTGAAEDVRITDTLPEGFSFIDTGSAKRVWMIGTLLAGEKRTVTYDVAVADNVRAGQHENVAVATAVNHVSVQDTASVDVRRPKVLGALTTTGPSGRDYILLLSGLAVLIIAGVGLRRLRGLPV